MNFSGGEPFLPDRGRYLGEMVRFCKQDLRMPSVSIVSNGSLIKEKWFREYGKCFTSITPHRGFSKGCWKGVNIVNRSRPRLTSCLLKKQARHQCDVCTPSSDCLVGYNRFVTLKKCMAATVNKFLRSRQENINN